MQQYQGVLEVDTKDYKSGIELLFQHQVKQHSSIVQRDGQLLKNNIPNKNIVFPLLSLKSDSEILQITSLKQKQVAIEKIIQSDSKIYKQHLRHHKILSIFKLQGLIVAFAFCQHNMIHNVAMFIVGLVLFLIGCAIDALKGLDHKRILFLFDSNTSF